MSRVAPVEHLCSHIASSREPQFLELKLEGWGGVSYMQERAYGVWAKGQGWREGNRWRRAGDAGRTLEGIQLHLSKTPKVAEKRPVAGTSVDMRPLGLEPLPALVTVEQRDRVIGANPQV